MAYSRTCPPASPITAPTRVVYRDFYIPQPVEIQHPIQIVNRYHCVPVPYHTVQCTERDEQAAAVCGRRRNKRAKVKSRK